MSGKSAEFIFVARQSEDGGPFVALQPKHEGATFRGEIGLDLYRGTSLAEAKQLARFLNSNIKSVHYRGDRPTQSRPLSGR